MSANRFLVFQHAEPKSLLFRRLAASGESRVAQGGEDFAGFHLAVVDCASVPAGEMSGLLGPLSTALDQNVPILLLEPGEEHKKSLAPKVHGWSSGDSVACFLYPIQDPHGRRTYAVHEQFGPRRPDVPLMAVEAHRDSNGKVVFAEPVKIAASTGNPQPALEEEHVVELIADVTRVLGELRQKGVVEALSTPPADCPYWASPYKIYQPWYVGGYSGSPDATQYVSGTAEVGIYYDNLTYANPVQWTQVSNQGNYSADIVVNNGSGLGWSIGGFQVLGPALGSSTQGDFSLYQSSPQSVSGQTGYTSSVEFSVGVKAGTDGLSANASYTESNSVTYSLNDWEITLTGDDSWNFYQQVPYNGETQDFPDGAESGGGPAALPAISTSSLSFATQTVWLVLNPLQITMPINFSYQSYPTCILFSKTGKHWKATFYYYPGGLMFTNTYNLDFGPANPTTT